MGHKGVSKRKPGKTKLAPVSNGKVGSSGPSAMKTRVGDIEKVSPAAKDGVKSPSNSKKKNKKE